MRLTAEQYEQIVTSLRSDSTRTRHHEKRHSPRVGLRMQVTVIPCVTGQPAKQYEMWVRDLSTNGIGLIGSEPARVGSYFLAVFKRATNETLTVLYRVVNCRQQTDRQYSIGAKLDRVIDAGPAAEGSAA